MTQTDALKSQYRAIAEDPREGPGACLAYLLEVLVPHLEARLARMDSALAFFADQENYTTPNDGAGDFEEGYEPESHLIIDPAPWARAREARVDEA
jgi:hypothetical protein